MRKNRKVVHDNPYQGTPLQLNWKSVCLQNGDKITLSGNVHQQCITVSRLNSQQHIYIKIKTEVWAEEPCWVVWRERQGKKVVRWNTERLFLRSELRLAIPVVVWQVISKFLSSLANVVVACKAFSKMGYISSELHITNTALMVNHIDLAEHVVLHGDCAYPVFTKQFPRAKEGRIMNADQAKVSEVLDKLHELCPNIEVLHLPHIPASFTNGAFVNVHSLVVVPGKHFKETYQDKYYTTLLGYLPALQHIKLFLSDLSHFDMNFTELVRSEVHSVTLRDVSMNIDSLLKTPPRVKDLHLECVVLRSTSKYDEVATWPGCKNVKSLKVKVIYNSLPRFLPELVNLEELVLGDWQSTNEIDNFTAARIAWELERLCLRQIVLFDERLLPQAHEHLEVLKLFCLKGDLKSNLNHFVKLRELHLDDKEVARASIHVTAHASLEVLVLWFRAETIATGSIFAHYYLNNICEQLVTCPCFRVLRIVKTDAHNNLLCEANYNRARIERAQWDQASPADFILLEA